ncbi:MAG: GC-type dockerin domain-anchored protein [Phycisphaerales bacterium]
MTARTMPVAALVAAALSAALPSAASAQEVLVLSSGNATLDQAVLNVLAAHGLNGTLGQPYHEFTASINLCGFDCVYMQANNNWSAGNMPEPGQQGIVDLINRGGGFVTTEWSVWKSSAATLETLAEAYAAAPASTFNAAATTTYTQVTPDPIVSNGLPTDFTFMLDSFSGTNNSLVPKPGATVFYSSSALDNGVVGWDFGSGRAIHISACGGLNALNDPNFARLLTNAMRWSFGRPRTCIPDITTGAVAGQPGYGVANCALNNDDFFYFLAQFAVGNAAVCDLTTGAVPGQPGYGMPNGIINNDDFFYYLALFAAGC